MKTHIDNSRSRLDQDVKQPDYRYARVIIRCGRDSKTAIWKAGRRHGGAYANAYRFECCDCRTKWTMHDFSGADDPEHITCSHCYSEKVLITEIRIVMPERKAAAL